MFRTFAASSSLSTVARRRVLAAAVAAVVLGLVAGGIIFRGGNTDGDAGSNTRHADRLAALRGATSPTIAGSSRTDPTAPTISSTTTATGPMTTATGPMTTATGPMTTATGPTTTATGPTTTATGPMTTATSPMTTATSPMTTTTSPTTTTTSPTTIATTSPPQPSSDTATTQPLAGDVAPLAGLRGLDASLSSRPALAVKIDNLDTAGETAVPQTGLTKTDVVFEEVVEGDITRLVAVFHSQTPDRVGPVRSARTTDLAILPQLGRPLLAWSGGNDGVVAAVHASPSIVDEGFDAASSAYSRDQGRRAPHNLYVRPSALWARAPQGLAGPPPLFTYRADGQPSPPTARPAAGVDLRWGPTSQAPARWRWDANLHRYLREQRGRPHVDTDGTRISAANVVVLVTEYGRSPADTRSPEAHTVGGGEAFVFTDGTVVHGHWDRPDVNRPAALTDDAGAPIALMPGNTWVELPMPGGATVVR